MKKKALVFYCFLGFVSGCMAEKVPAKEQLQNLQQKQILVPMWGWPVEEMAPAAKKFGYEAVNAPHGNDMEKIKKEIAVWSRYGLKMIARPALEVADPFDPGDVSRGIDKLNHLIDFYDTQDDVVGIVISWGLFGEGGFPWDYEFSEKAKNSFNRYMNTPGGDLPKRPDIGHPGSMRWLKWMEYRSDVLTEFRRTFIASAKKHTDKLVGTWSEVYPTEHYTLNMGCAPGADFLFYDLSFGDVTCNQRIAFGESHGDMQHYDSFEAWRDHELPLMAKAAGEGVVPMAFQFPMRRGHATDFLSKTTVFIDKIEDEYALRIGPEIRKLAALRNMPVPQPQVALVYQSFAAAGLPGGGEPDIAGSVKVLPFYENVSAKQMEGMLHQMGVRMTVIPYEALRYRDLSRFEVVIVPDPVYMPDAISRNLKKAKRLLLCGELMLAHRDPASVQGDYTSEKGFSAVTRTDSETLRYFRADAGSLQLSEPDHRWFKSVIVPGDKPYPADQMFEFAAMPSGAKVLMTVSGKPVVVTENNGQTTYLTNHLLNHAWHDDSGGLETMLFGFMRNYLADAGVEIRVATPSLVRVKESRFYGSYGVTGHVGWNTTDHDLQIEMSDGSRVSVPKYGWTKID